MREPDTNKLEPQTRSAIDIGDVLAQASAASGRTKRDSASARSTAARSENAQSETAEPYPSEDVGD
jgi:hypothetical protein